MPPAAKTAKDIGAAAFVLVHLVTSASRAATAAPHEHLERELADIALRYLLP